MSDSESREVNSEFCENSEPQTHVRQAVIAHETNQSIKQTHMVLHCKVASD